MRYIVSAPEGLAPQPLLCFLHGYDEAAPEPIDSALRRHGPLKSGNPAWIRSHFIVLAPQLPRGGDDWLRYARNIGAAIEQVHVKHALDMERMYLTGFSFGGNGVFDLAEREHPWAALWAVDPTRVPRHPIDTPVWFSFGEVSRRCKADFIRTLGLVPAPCGKHVYTDSGDDHVGSARQAYSDLAAYEWLLQQRRPSS